MWEDLGIYNEETHNCFGIKKKKAKIQQNRTPLTFSTDLEGGVEEGVGNCFLFIPEIREFGYLNRS